MTKERSSPFSGPMSRRTFVQTGLLGMAELTVADNPAVSAAPVQKEAKHKGDWPMTRGGLLRANRANTKGKISLIAEGVDAFLALQQQMAK